MRSVDIFFYGLFMDQQALEAQNLNPRNARMASVSGYKLHIGRRATLSPEEGAEAWGMVIGLPIEEAEQLYAEPSVADYKPEAVLAQTTDGQQVAALCYNLVSPGTDDTNKTYAAALHALAERLNLPDPYVTFLNTLAQ